VLRVVLDQLRTARPERIDSFPEAGKHLATAIDQILRVGQDPVATMHQAQALAAASLGTS
jgi:hypothetical protein